MAWNGCGYGGGYCIQRTKKMHRPGRCIFLAEKCGLGFELAAGTLAIRLGALNPTLSGAGILPRTAGGCRCAGAGALTGIDIKAFARFFTRGSAHRGYGEHCSSGCGQGDSGGFLSCDHLCILKVIYLAVRVFPHYASLEKPILQKVHKNSGNLKKPAGLRG
jgi:hypothetical protein